ncbi:hypothetical protein BD769DRAFT_1682092 [Suillus cothurnatus]|nr:hypothetical protein BD769DRAFT_1682092 [Suillus cothurnatus]
MVGGGQTPPTILYSQLPTLGKIMNLPHYNTSSREDANIEDGEIIDTDDIDTNVNTNANVAGQLDDNIVMEPSDRPQFFSWVYLYRLVYFLAMSSPTHHSNLNKLL